MNAFWLIVTVALLLGILLTIATGLVLIEYGEHRLVRDLKGDFNQWLVQDFKIAQSMPWPVTPNFASTAFGMGTAQWCIKAVVESYAIRYDPSYEPLIPDFSGKLYRFFGNGEFCGYGVVSADGGTALLVFHGTSDVADVVEDLEASQVAFPGSTTARVFSGLYTVTEDLQKNVLEWIEHLPEPKPRLLLTGHSSGGAVAVFLGARLDATCTIYTFGCPKLGNSAFQRLVDTGPVLHYRIINAADVIPTLPIGTKHYQYWPSGEPHVTYLETGQGSLNHGLSTYARALMAVN